MWCTIFSGIIRSFVRVCSLYFVFRAEKVNVLRIFAAITAKRTIRLPIVTVFIEMFSKAAVFLQKVYPVVISVSVFSRLAHLGLACTSTWLFSHHVPAPLPLIYTFQHFFVPLFCFESSSKANRFVVKKNFIGCMTAALTTDGQTDSLIFFAMSLFSIWLSSFLPQLLQYRQRPSIERCSTPHEILNFWQFSIQNYKLFREGIINRTKSKRILWSVGEIRWFIQQKIYKNIIWSDIFCL